jgi:hypothetical protein
VKTRIFLFLVLCACTDAGLFAAGSGGPAGPDRTEFKGTVCSPLAAGEAFPVKVIFALQGGAGVDRQLVGGVVDALNTVTSQFSTPYISFSIIGYHTVATGFQGSFARDSRIASAISRYGGFQETGPVSHRAALKLAGTIMGGDMQTSCRGQVARTRYYVVQVILDSDTSCANLGFNAGVNDRCTNFLSACDQCSNCAICDQARVQCSECELGATTFELKEQGVRLGAGEVTVQPVYVRVTPDPITRYEAAAIARAGGTELIETSPDNIQKTLAGLNYASLQTPLVIKRLVALNRNTLSRKGQVLVDSDGDGISDDEEDRIGTDKTNVDSDGDRLSDGVELRAGLAPQAGTPLNTIQACNVENDADGDRLNDCEERLLGTESCVADSDGDGLNDLVEFLGQTNALVPENLTDSDGDGSPNVEELAAHTDPLSADIGFSRERGYGYSIVEAKPTADGRACYNVNVYNMTVAPTLERPSPDGSGAIVPKGINDLYLYFQVGRQNDPTGTGIGSLFVQSVKFTPPGTKKPKGTLGFNPEDFVSGY